jgi:hypothetical protein
MSGNSDPFSFRNFGRHVSQNLEFYCERKKPASDKVSVWPSQGARGFESLPVRGSSDFSGAMPVWRPLTCPLRPGHSAPLNCSRWPGYPAKTVDLQRVTTRAISPPLLPSCRVSHCGSAVNCSPFRLVLAPFVRLPPQSSAGRTPSAAQIASKGQPTTQVRSR